MAIDYSQVTPCYVRDWRDSIEKNIKRDDDDYATAHSEQDELAETVLRAIAAGSPHPQELARIAVEVFEIEFPRHYA